MKVCGMLHAVTTSPQGDGITIICWRGILFPSLPCPDCL